MVLPLIPVALAGIGGTVAGGFLAGGKGSLVNVDASKKEMHAAGENYAPVVTDARSFASTYNPTQIITIDSPHARITKKDDLRTTAKSSPEVTSRPDMGERSGTDLTMIAIIGAAGLLGYAVIKEVL